MRHIVLCVSISTNELTTTFLSIVERNVTHCSMCVYFYECAYDVLLSIKEGNERHIVLCVSISTNELTSVSSAL